MSEKHKCIWYYSNDDSLLLKIVVFIRTIDSLVFYLSWCCDELDIGGAPFRELVITMVNVQIVIHLFICKTLFEERLLMLYLHQGYWNLVSLHVSHSLMSLKLNCVSMETYLSFFSSLDIRSHLEVYMCQGLVSEKLGLSMFFVKFRNALPLQYGNWRQSKNRCADRDPLAHCMHLGQDIPQASWIWNAESDWS